MSTPSDFHGDRKWRRRIPRAQPPRMRRARPLAAGWPRDRPIRVGAQRGRQQVAAAHLYLSAQNKSEPHGVRARRPKSDRGAAAALADDVAAARRQVGRPAGRQQLGAAIYGRISCRGYKARQRLTSIRGAQVSFGGGRGGATEPPRERYLVIRPAPESRPHHYHCRSWRGGGAPGKCRPANWLLGTGAPLCAPADSFAS